MIINEYELQIEIYKHLLEKEFLKEGLILEDANSGESFYDWITSLFGGLG